MRDYVDGSGVTTTAEKSEEFISLYAEAFKVYEEEGGRGELGISHVKVYTIHINLTSRIVFKIFVSGRSKIPFTVKAPLSTNPMTKIQKGTMGTRKRHASKSLLLLLRLRNSELFFPMKKSTSGPSAAVLYFWKTSANV